MFLPGHIGLFFAIQELQPAIQVANQYHDLESVDSACRTVDIAQAARIISMLATFHTPRARNRYASPEPAG